jgi:hypothetical protein
MHVWPESNGPLHVSTPVPPGQLLAQVLQAGHTTLCPQIVTVVSQRPQQSPKEPVGLTQTLLWHHMPLPGAPQQVRFVKLGLNTHPPA